MLIKTILNQVYHLKSFVYGAVRLLDLEGGCELEVEVAPRANSKPICRKCSYKGGCYDRQPPRRYEFVPLWGMKVFLVYAARRVNCPGCGVVVELPALGRGEEPADHTVPAVYCPLG